MNNIEKAGFVNFNYVTVNHKKALRSSSVFTFLTFKNPLRGLLFVLNGGLPFSIKFFADFGIIDP